MNDELLAAGGMIALAILLLLAYQYLFSNHEQVVGDYHVHADFKVYLQGKAYNFSQEKYMSEAQGSVNETGNNTNSTGSATTKVSRKLLSNFVHLHDGDGEAIHAHLKGITLGYFFKTLGMKFNSTCFVTGSNESYCNNASGSLKFFVNRKQRSEFDKYEFNDLDRILVSFGNESAQQLQAQVDSVSDKACIPSGKCPERGTPGNESSCSTGGTGCLPEPTFPN